MNQSIDPINEHDLHAYIDGQLNKRRQLEVEKHLADNPSDLARIRDYQNLNNLLHKRQRQILRESLPHRLSRLVGNYNTRWRRYSTYIAASVIWAVVGGVIGWGIHDNSSNITVNNAPLAQNAAYAHAVYTAEPLHAVEIKADKEKHLVAWLSKRLKRNLHVPNLTGFGYELMGGRLLPSNGSPAAQFMYENQAGNRLTLYVRVKQQNDNITTFRFAKHENLSTFYWIDGSLGYAMTGEVDRTTLLDIASVVYQILENQ